MSSAAFARPLLCPSGAFCLAALVLATAPASAAPLYGALAVGEDSQRWGMSHDHPTQAIADQQALAQCAGRDCRVVQRFEGGQCAAIATAAIGLEDFSYGYGVGTREQANDLAGSLVAVGRAYGVKTAALLTDMNQPLGREVGNANEIRESLAILRGEGPADATELVYRLGVEMLRLADRDEGRADARRRLEETVSSGSALEVFARVIEAQGGNPGVLDNESLLPQPAHVWEYTASTEGTVVECDPLDIGNAVVRLGGGRQEKQDEVDPAVGVTVLAKLGDRVAQGQPLARVSYNHQSQLDNARELLESAWVISDGPAPEHPLIIGEIR